jgi:nucleotide-binding universal stress UspA family protein
MTKITKILCAIDLTKASGNAFDRALAIAGANKGKLYVLHVVPAARPFSWQAKERVAFLARIKQRADREGVPIRIVEQHAEPARAIILHADSTKAHLVVLGSNRRRGWQRFREGSVGERVLRGAAWPVLIVPWDA